MSLKRRAGKGPADEEARDSLDVDESGRFGDGASDSGLSEDEHAEDLRLKDSDEEQDADVGDSPGEAEDDDGDRVPENTLQEELTEMTIEERQEVINEEHPFGIPIWKPALHVKTRTIDYVLEEDIHHNTADPEAAPSTRLRLMNLLWTFLFGWILALVFYLVSVLASFISVGSLALEFTDLSETYGALATVLRELAPYVLSPFGLYLERVSPATSTEGRGPNSSLGADSPLLNPVANSPRSLCGLRFILLLGVLPVQFTIALLCWLLIAPIPMARFLTHLAWELWKDPTTLRVRAPGYQSEESRTTLVGEQDETVVFVRGESNGHAELMGGKESVVVLSVVRSTSLRYFKFTIGGVNVFIFNSLIVPIVTLFLSYLPRFNHPIALFTLSLLSIVPCAYFIGAAISAITNLTGNLALGAILNATFGSIVEILIYIAMIRQGDKAKLVEGSLIGSFLFGMLCMPGLAMLFGGMSKRTMAFNVRATGVTVTLLIMSVIGVLVPTLFHNTFAPWDLFCRSCSYPNGGRVPTTLLHSGKEDSPDNSCEMSSCWMKQTTGNANPLFESSTRPLMYFCCAILVLTYCVGLVYTLRTHQKHIYKKKTDKRGKGRGGKGGKSRPEMLPTGTGGTPRIGWNSPRTPAMGSSLDRRLRKSGEPGATPNVLPLRPAQLLNLEPDMGKPPIGPGPASATSSVGITSPLATSALAADQISLSSTSSHSSGGAERDHGGPAWGTARSVVVLLLSTVMFSLVAEVLVDSVDEVLARDDNLGPKLDQKLLGLTLFAIVPSITEIYNSISFALLGKMQLAMEIANQYTTQVSLLQIPLIVAFSALHDYVSNRPPGVDGGFSLVFPRWDAYAILFSVFLISYIYVEGKATYFKGAMLVLAYFVLLVSFGFVPSQFEEQVVSLPHGRGRV